MKDKKFVIFIFLVSALLRFSFVYFFIGFNAEEIRDGTFFDNVATNIAEGKGISLANGLPTAKRPPVYMIFLGILYFIFGHSLVIARIAQCLIGAFIPVVIYFITKELFPAPVDKIASLFTAFDPTLIFFCGRILVEPMLALFIALFIWAIVKTHSPSQFGYQFLSGIFFGLSILTRPLLAFLPIFLVFWPFWKWQEEKKTTLLKINTVIFSGFLLIYLPWVIRNYRLFNSFMPITTETGLTLWLSSHPEGKGYIKARGLSPRYVPIKNIQNKKSDFPSTRNFILDIPWGGLNEKEVDDKFINLFLTWVKKNPVKYLKLIPQKLLGFWDGLYLIVPFDPMVVPNKLWIIIPFIFVMPFAIYGIADSFRNRGNYLIFYMIFISIHILILLTFADYRMRSIFMPYFYIFMGSGIMKIIQKFDYNSLYRKNQNQSEYKNKTQRE